MEPSAARTLAALLCSLLSQTLLVLLLPSPYAAAAASSSAAPFHLLRLLAPPAVATRKRKRGGDPSSATSDPDSELSDATPERPPDLFPLCFRMSSSSFEWLSGLLEPLLDSGPDLQPSSRLAVGLFRLSTGCAYAEVARAFNIPETSARSCTKRLCRVLCTNYRFFLAFPTDVRAITDAFGAIPGGLPGCCGAIASARLPARGKSSVLVQVVADTDYRILSIGAGCGGRKAGSWTGLRESSLYKDVEDRKLLGPGLYLVAGEGYPLLRWVMVRFPGAELGSKEEAFNKAHRGMLRPAGRTLRSLRNWGVLGGEMRDEERRMGVACVGSCAILHNMLLTREDFSALASEEGDSFNDDWSVEDVGLVERTDGEEAAYFRSHLAEMAKELQDPNGFSRRQLLLMAPPIS